MASTSLDLQPQKLPNQSCAYTNKVYVSHEDCAKLYDQRSQDSHYIQINGCVFSLDVHASATVGTISLSDLQRKFARVGLFQPVSVRPFFPPVPFELASCSVEVEVLQPARSTARNVVTLEGARLLEAFRTMFAEQVLANEQQLVLDFQGICLKCTVVDTQPLDIGTASAEPMRLAKGILNSQTQLKFHAAASALGQLLIEGSSTEQRTIFNPDFNFQELGVGGVSKEFGNIFRRAFAARCLPQRVVREMGIEHVRGMLLHGPPGCGKTMIARQLAKFLKAAEPKIVNGPEILNKYVGQAEENVRKLFMDAEKDQSLYGDSSQLHVIILDEMDAICKKRGSSGDSTGTTDNIVNQFLAKIDGVNALSNVILIGMTNRKDMIDPALLRPGRLELHVEISLPDDAGRTEILNIHTAKMREHGYLAEDVSLSTVAARSKKLFWC
jgi:vesicle-fusing ATPase